VEYTFINRGKTQFPPGFAAALQEQIAHMATLRHADSELQYLDSLRHIKPAFVDFLGGFYWNPEFITITDKPNFGVTVRGPWYKTIFYEVPILALISELYYQLTGQIIGDWSAVRKTAREKGRRLAEAGCDYADFGTRRRRSHAVQKEVVPALREGSRSVVRNAAAGESLGKMVGTSNLLFAMLNDLATIGTHAHELFQAMAAMFGYRQANRFTLEAWAEEYDGDLGIALSDTFTSDVFFHDFRRDMAKLWDGVRHDSGDPFVFAQKTIDHYKSLGIDPLSKTIVFSDSLDVDKAIELQKWCEGKIKCSVVIAPSVKCAFGIGTHFTNDVGAIPLNIVMKMTRCNGVPTVKLSDAVGKNTGEPDAIESCKFQLGLDI